MRILCAGQTQPDSIRRRRNPHEWYQINQKNGRLFYGKIPFHTRRARTLRRRACARGKHCDDAHAVQTPPLPAEKMRVRKGHIFGWCANACESNGRNICRRGGYLPCRRNGRNVRMRAFDAAGRSAAHLKFFSKSRNTRFLQKSGVFSEVTAGNCDLTTLRL